MKESEMSYCRGTFLDIVSEVATSDRVLDEYLCSAPVSKHTSKTVPSELLDFMCEVYKQTLTEDIRNANFVSIQAYEPSEHVAGCHIVTIC
jgi:hypothetical protein